MAVNDTKTWIGSTGPFLSDSSKTNSGLRTDKAPASSIDVIRLTDIGNGLISAADVVNVPAGSIAAINVQAAINELDTEKAPALGVDDNYVTDAEKVVIGNTSGVNTGDQVGDGVTITGVGTAGNPFVSSGISRAQAYAIGSLRI